MTTGEAGAALHRQLPTTTATIHIHFIRSSFHGWAIVVSMSARQHLVVAMLIRIGLFGAVFAWFVHANFTTTTHPMYGLPLAGLAGLLCAMATCWGQLRSGRCVVVADDRLPRWQPWRLGVAASVVATLVAGVMMNVVPPTALAMIGVVIGVVAGHRAPPRVQPIHRSEPTQMLVHAAMGAALGAMIAIIAVNNINYAISTAAWALGLAGGVVTSTAIGFMSGARSLTEAKLGVVVTPVDDRDHMPVLIPALVLMVITLLLSRTDQGELHPTWVWTTKVGGTAALSALFAAMGGRQGASRGTQMRAR
jgi:hypothetical protein